MFLFPGYGTSVHSATFFIRHRFAYFTAISVENSHRHCDQMRCSCISKLKWFCEHLLQTNCRLQLHPTVRKNSALASLSVRLLDCSASSSLNHSLSLLIMMTCNWPWCRHRVFNLALVPLQSTFLVLTGPDAVSDCRRLLQQHGTASVAPETFANQWIFMQSSWRKSGGKPKYSFH